jgi:spermidine synthase
MLDSAGVGRHTICELWDARHLDSVDVVERALRDAAAAGNCTLLQTYVHQFAPHGVSGIAVIAESHVALHTWPEYGYCAADIFTCGDTANLDAMVETLRAAFDAERVDSRTLTRGQPIGRFEESEPFSASHAAYDIVQVLERRRTEYQELVLFESPRLGRVMALDGIVQLTDLDTFVYHEMLAHPALFAHPAPKAVAVVGGGDVHLVAEVLKHPGIEAVHLLELDEEVVEISRKHYSLARDTLNDPRVDVRPGDAFDTIEELSGQLDAILVDLTDPIGPAARLFESPFYALCERSLRADGFLVAQTESIHFHADTVRSTQAALAQTFACSDLMWTSIATYPGAFWTFGIATKGLDPRVVRRRPEMSNRLYHPDAHEWFFLPAPVRQQLLGI